MDYIVTTLADSGHGSLRWAINQANASPGFDAIGFSSSLAGGTISLSSALPVIDDQLDVHGLGDGRSLASITIDCNGHQGLVLRGEKTALSSLHGLSIVDASGENPVLAMNSIGTQPPPFGNASIGDNIDSITGVETPIKNGNEGMITSRFQDHSWVTDDGAVHILANVRNKLTMYSSLDDGASWKQTASLRNSSGSTRSDGILIGDDLYEIYTTSKGGLRLATFKYSQVDFTWNLKSDLALHQICRTEA